MQWREYVQRVIGEDSQSEVSRRTGIDQATVSRWLSAERATAGRQITSQKVAAFARGYHRPVLEAFVVAGFLTADEAGMTASPLHDLSEVDAVVLIAELNRRLHPDRNPIAPHAPS